MRPFVVVVFVVGCVFDKVVVWCVVVVGARWLCVFGTVCVDEEMVKHIGWHERRDGV